ncbi:MAG: hypothetical protein IPK26_08590 [Planctomycetes bacterium]|nr:hypothetical protein [Planctomycetota bacterium]
MFAAAEVVLPLRAQASTWLRIGLALLVGAGIAAAVPFEIAAIVLCSLGVTPLVVGLVLRAVAGRHERAVAALLAGDAELRWCYPEAQWRAHVAAERRTARRFDWLLVGLGALAGFGAAAGFAEESDGFAGSHALAWVVPPLIGALFGQVVATVVRAHQRARFDRMERSPGVFCLGKHGMYLTGSYWPWNDIDISLRGVEIDAQGMLFHFAVGDGGQQSVRVPIAAGHDAAARAWVERGNRV